MVKEKGYKDGVVEVHMLGQVGPREALIALGTVHVDGLVQA